MVDCRRKVYELWMAMSDESDELNIVCEYHVCFILTGLHVIGVNASPHLRKPPSNVFGPLAHMEPVRRTFPSFENFCSCGKPCW